MKTKLKLRKITYYDREHKEPSSLLAIYLNFEPTIAALYKLRWQIELLFKQIKQNLLKYFLGDNENAIKIQIYCVLIVNLLIVIKKSLKRQWSFSNLVSFVEFIYSTIFI
jgi:IS4 transposase